MDTTEEEPEISLKDLTAKIRNTDREIKKENQSLLELMKNLTFQNSQTKEEVEALIHVFEEM